MIQIQRPLLSLRKTLILAAAVLLVLIISIATSKAWAASDTPVASRSGQHVLTVYDAGTEKGILTEAKTVGEALKEAGITLSPTDVTEPARDEQLVAANYDINIYRARPVVIEDGANRTKVMSPYRTASQIAKQAGVPLQAEDSVKLQPATDIVRDGALEKLVIERATPFTLVFYGKKTTAYTQKATVAEMLKDKNIVPGADDTLSVPLEAAITPGMTIELWRNGTQTITEEHEVNFATEKVQDTNREPGYREVQTAGKKGKKTVTYEITMKNGVEEARKEINSVVTEQPVKQVEVVGAKFKYTGGPLSDAQITALGMCESGMTATRNSGNGFYGAFQFMPSTWRSVAPTPYNGGMPHEAPLDAQKQAVQTLLSRSSIYTQFPGCARKMTASGVL